MTEPRPPRTRVASYALCTDDVGRLLGVRVAYGYPSAGEWMLPGGGLEFGEDPATGALRELTEETGLRGEISSLAFVDSRTFAGNAEAGLGPWHGIRIVYRVVVTGGEMTDELRGSTETCRWLTREEATNLPLVDLAHVALRFLDGQ